MTDPHATPDRAAIVTHAVEIHAFGHEFFAFKGDTLEVIGGILHINGLSLKAMAGDRHAHLATVMKAIPR